MRSLRPENIIYSPFAMALLFSVLIAFFLPKQPKYTLALVNSWRIEKNGGVSFYTDLDGNGFSEYLIGFENASGKLALKLMRIDERLIDQFNFTGAPLPHITKQQIFTGDYNDDGVQEIYALSCRNDSIFMDIISPMQEGGLNRKGIFVDTIASFSEMPDYTGVISGLYDFTGDGSKDVLIRSHAGFSLYPRRLYIYNIPGNSLYASPVAGVVPGHFHILDITGDGRPEIVGSTTGHGNIPPDVNISYRDSSSYLMILNSQLEFLFEPVEFPVYKSRIAARPLIREQDTLIMAVFLNEGTEAVPNTVYLFDLEGRIIAEKSFPEPLKNRLLKAKHIQTHPYLYLLDKQGTIYSLRENMTLKQHGLTETDIYFSFSFLDIDLDGKPEIIGVDDMYNTLHISRHDFSHTAKLQLPAGEFREIWYSLRQEGKNKPELFMQYDEKCLRISYALNPAYPYRYAIYLVVLLSMWLLMAMLKRLFKYQLLKKQRMAEQMVTLQYQAIHNQLNPHFILNAMNSLAQSIKQQKGDAAYEYTAKFSNLFRETLQHADKVSRSLEEELAFVDDYLQLEQLRHKSMFSYQINITAGVDKHIQVPKMIIQILVENAIKHGLQPLGKGGLLRIDVDYSKRNIHIIIRDNGIGRAAARAKGSSGFGKGLHILDEMVGLYKKITGTPIAYKIIDETDENGKASGTRVELVLGAQSS
jgi:hypothetical protein